MALQQLTDEQTRTWTRAQKDRWWFEKVFRGDMPQLTLRSGLTGFLIGFVLAATALYIAAKTGISIGVNLTSVIVAFGVFRVLAKAGWMSDLTILENNCAQSIASAAGYMVTPLTTSLAAYMVITGHILEWWQMLAWMAVVALLGVLVAFPMKRRFVNEDQLPFPEGRAAGVVLDALYTGQEAAGLFRAKLLAMTTIVTGVWQFIISDGWMRFLQFTVLRMHQWAGLKEPWYFEETIDNYYYAAGAKYSWWVPKILGTDIRQLGLRLTFDAAMLGVGGLMGIRVATSCMLGAFINFAVLAPIIIQRGEIKSYIAPSGALVNISRGEIVNQWSLWWGVVMMVVGALVGLFSKPELFTRAFATLFKRSASNGAAADVARDDDVLRDIELPLWVSFVGVPILGVLGAWVNHAFFGVPWLLSFISLPLIIVLAVICTNSMALTSWMPTGALSKITQFTMGAIDRTNPASNILPAGMTGEISSNAASLLSDIKPGYMLGAKPRQQAIGHVIGIFSGSLAVIPLFFLLFAPANKEGVRSTATIISERFPMPAALQWKGVADIIAKGVHSLPTSAIISMIVAAVAAATFEILRIKTRGRFPISAVSVGLGVVLPPASCFMMWVGAMVFWWKGRQHATPGTKGHELWVEGYESICAGLISGSALVGIGNAIINVLLG